MKISDMRSSYTKKFGDIPVKSVFCHNGMENFLMKTSNMTISTCYGLDEINAISLMDGTHKKIDPDTEVLVLNAELFIT